MNKHFNFIDISKGIAIILMVLGHSSIPVALSNFIWTFHMPLFFIASGFTTMWGGNGSLCEYCCKKVKSLLIPFIIYSLIILLIEKGEGWISLTDWIRVGWKGYALWFIPVLFLALIAVKGLFLIRNNVLRFGILVFIVMIGYGLSYFKLSLPWNMSSVPYAIFMIMIGAEMRKTQIAFDKIKSWILLVVTLLTVLISKFYRLDMCSNSITPIMPITLGAITGTLMVFRVSGIIDKRFKLVGEILTKIGKNTFVILAFSQIVIMLLNEYFLLNVLFKYLLLVLVLLILCMLKSYINNITHKRFL